MTQSLSSSVRLPEKWRWRVDEARHDGLARAVLDLIARRNLGARTRVGDLLVVDQDEGVVHGSSARAIDEPATNECVLAHDDSSKHDNPACYLLFIACTPRGAPKASLLGGTSRTP